MKRIEIVYNKLKELYCGNGISASSLAEVLGLSRANVSSDLNKLCEEGLILKDKKKTVLFSINEGFKKKDIFDMFFEKNKSLKISIEQAKAAVMYPPNGMHMLILGETGVGKSMFANLISKYAIEIKKMDKNSPFIVFNCADYSNNPQLLISQIFGTKKGAYTGANDDKIGLIEMANNGILFLDEVHRLPPEGQEMFFTFMDKGVFRRLGETDVERSANVLIISATTEDTESTLLKTFTRRIPMIINIPSLRDRTIDERFNLITNFFKEEALILGKNIMVSINTMKCFLGYNCVNNVGQLRTDIKLACAKAYLEFATNKKNKITINSMSLPESIRQGLYIQTEHRQLWYKLMDISSRYITFDLNGNNMIYEDELNQKNVYKMIDNNIVKLKNTGITTDELVIEMERDIEGFFDKYIEDVNEKFSISKLESIIDIEIIKIVSEIINFSENYLGRKISEKIYYGLAVHIDNAIKRIKNKEQIINLKLNEIRSNNKDAFNAALQCIDIIEKKLNIMVPIDEAGFIAIFLAYNESNEIESNKVKIIVVAHGIATASSMVDTVNTLLGVKYATAINAPIDEKPKDTIDRLKKQLINENNKNDILFLVDMGSLINIGEEIKEAMNIDCKTIQLVSTLHVLEATRKACLGESLEEIYLSTISINSLVNTNLLEKQIRKNETIKTVKASVKELAIITICSTGSGGALASKEFLQTRLENKKIKIIPIGIYNDENINITIKKIEKEYRVVCIISTFNINTDLPQFTLEDIIKLDKTEEIKELIEIENTYMKICETLEPQLKHIKVKQMIDDIKEFNEILQERLNNRISSSILIGVTIHIAYLIDRLKNSKFIMEAQGNKLDYINENKELYEVVKEECEKLFSKYGMEVGSAEVFYILKSFDKNSYAYRKN